MTDRLQKIIDKLKEVHSNLWAYASSEMLLELEGVIVRLEALQGEPVAWLIRFGDDYDVTKSKQVADMMASDPDAANPEPLCAAPPQSDR